MTAPPTILAQRVLRTIREHGIIEGRRLADQLSVAYPDLAQAVAMLRELDLIDVEGDAHNPRRLPSAHIAYRPSSEARVEEFLAQR